MARPGLRLTPQGHLVLEAAQEAEEVEETLAARLGAAFAHGGGRLLLQLGAGEVGRALPPAFVWWRDFAGRYVAQLCAHGGGPDKALPAIAPPTDAELASLVLTAPLMPGAEYFSQDTLIALWNALAEAAAQAVTEAQTDLQTFLKTLNPAWNLVGRVHFNLAENKRDAERPFAFLATYTTRLSVHAKAQHVPLGDALREYKGRRERLLSLLVPVQRAAESCAWLKAMVDAGEIFHPLRWSPADAAAMLSDAEKLEAAGVVLRIPQRWRTSRPPRPQVTATVGAKPPSSIGLDGLLDFNMAVTLDGEALSKKEIAALLVGTDSLVLMRGQWIEVDRERLARAMEQFAAAQALAESQGLTFAEAMRLVAGAGIAAPDGDVAAVEWSRVSAGPWLAETLKALRTPNGALANSGSALKGSLRPYQKEGVAWLSLIAGLGLGACLADDMGLGKTIQVLALLLQKKKDAGSKPSILVAPASLLGNWAAEIEKFAPSLKTTIVHPSANPEFKSFAAPDFDACDLAITSYGTLLRMPVLRERAWRYAILDEAQAIKNPDARQTRAAKALKAEARIALTGTPVENHLGDLWSIFDFLNPGLLGTAKEFKRYAKGLAEREHNPYGPLRALVGPYVLRRMKTDKSVIADLPDKTEVTAWCLLSRKQAALYADTVKALAESLNAADGIQRRGIVLASLMRLKQICNHPSQWLRDNQWRADDSGKWARLGEIASVVGDKQEKMLVFTQFREIAAPLAGFLAGVFGRSGPVLHGDTPVKDRKALVASFQEDEAVPFFVLSLKAGGSGLNLTAASHVVHFDRWWNPAVENQATDRAFRIGQKKNVLVHKFVCRGTVEEKIDALIESKKSLSHELLAGSAEVAVTEMSDADLLRLVSLDLAAAMRE